MIRTKIIEFGMPLSKKYQQRQQIKQNTSDDKVNILFDDGRSQRSASPMIRGVSQKTDSHFGSEL